MLGNFLKIDYIVVCFLKSVNSACFFMGNDRLRGKQVGSQASRRVTQRLARIQPVCISINAVPALKGLMHTTPHTVCVLCLCVKYSIECNCTDVMRHFTYLTIHILVPYCLLLIYCYIYTHC